MKLLDLTLPTPQQNLACDEVLLEECENGQEPGILRFWAPSRYFIVLGYSNKARSEVRLPECRAAGIPVFRRRSGGGAVLQGPGCLNYSLILEIPDPSPLQSIDGAARLILERHQRALEPLLGPGLRIRGLGDLAIGDLKFSGSAQYRRRRALLFHGAFLLHLDLDLMETLLPLPSKQPPYREGRSHRAFLTNLRLPATVIKEALQKAWNTTAPVEDVPFARIDALAEKTYSIDPWNFRA
jgi:lipoate-protein ligase A